MEKSNDLHQSIRIWRVLHATSWRAIVRAPARNHVAGGYMSIFIAFVSFMVSVLMFKLSFDAYLDEYLTRFERASFGTFLLVLGSVLIYLTAALLEKQV